MRVHSHDKLDISAEAMKVAAKRLADRRLPDAQTARAAVLAGLRHGTKFGFLAGSDAGPVRFGERVTWVVWPEGEGRRELCRRLVAPLVAEGHRFVRLARQTALENLIASGYGQAYCLNMANPGRGWKTTLKNLGDNDEPGIAVMGGSTGSGKSDTLSRLIWEIKESDLLNVLTVDSPWLRIAADTEHYDHQSIAEFCVSGYPGHQGQEAEKFLAALTPVTVILDGIDLLANDDIVGRLIMRAKKDPEFRLIIFPDSQQVETLAEAFDDCDLLHAHPVPSRRESFMGTLTTADGKTLVVSVPEAGSAGLPAAAEAAIERLTASLSQGDGASHVKRLEIVARACGYRSWHAAEGRVSDRALRSQGSVAGMSLLENLNAHLEDSVNLMARPDMTVHLQRVLEEYMNAAGPEMSMIALEFRKRVMRLPRLTGEYSDLDNRMIRHLFLDGPDSAFACLTAASASPDEIAILEEFAERLLAERENPLTPDILDAAKGSVQKIKREMDNMPPSPTYHPPHYLRLKIMQSLIWQNGGKFSHQGMRQMITAKSALSLMIAEKTPAGREEIKNGQAEFDAWCMSGRFKKTGLTHVVQNGAFFDNLRVAMVRRPATFGVFGKRYIEVYGEIGEHLLRLLEDKVLTPSVSG